MKDFNKSCQKILLALRRYDIPAGCSDLTEPDGTRVVSQRLSHACADLTPF
jgi:hypothetical protein